VRPDRLRYEFSFDGHLLDLKDGSGTDLRYVYQNQALPGIAKQLGLDPKKAVRQSYSAMAREYIRETKKLADRS